MYNAMLSTRDHTYSSLRPYALGPTQSEHSSFGFLPEEPCLNLSSFLNGYHC